LTARVVASAYHRGAVPSSWLAVGAETDALLERADGPVRELVAEQAALLRVAILVARGPTPDQLFAAVAEQVAGVLALPHVRLVRYAPEGPVVVGAFSGNDDEPFPIGSRWPLDGPESTATVRQTGRPARVEDYAPTTGEIAGAALGAGMRSAVASAIVVGGRSWGAMVVLSPRQEPLPKDTEPRLAVFTELVATAIATAESRSALARLADEQAALRRVATIAARESSTVGVLGAVAEEAARVSEAEAVGILRFEPDGTATLVAQSETPWDPPPLGTSFTLEGENVVAAVHRTGESARSDDWSSATGSVAAMAHVLGVRSALAAPIVVERSVWGALIAATSQTEPLPEETELRISEFTELVATAIANAESREALARLAAEQAALRRVAVLVAQSVPPAALFAAVIDELESLFHLDRDGTDIAGVVRFDPGPEFVAVGVSRGMDEVAGGTRWGPNDLYATTRVFRTGRAARVDAHELAEPGGPGAEFLRRKGFLSQVASPIVVEGLLWGAVNVNAREPLAAGTEDRLERFGELVATAIANVEARDALAGLVDEQAALRRVATLVAKESSLADVLASVGEEVGNVLGEVEWALARNDGDEMASVLASSGGNPSPAGTRVPIEVRAPFGRAMTEGRPARIDNYFAGAGPMSRLAREHGIRAAVSCPIVVRGHTWGSMSVGWRKPEPFPLETEALLGRFGDLVATAIANSEARAEVERLAEEQAALRRVATLVAQGVQPEASFLAVGEEIGRLFGSSLTMVGRFEHDGEALIAVSAGTGLEGMTVGSRWELKDLPASNEVFRTGRSVLIDKVDYSKTPTTLAAIGGRLGIESVVASPIFVEGRLWGVVSVSYSGQLPPKADERLEKFSELIATAIANADSRSELAASRRRIVAAADDARRRIERDLHDGIQQRLIALSFRARATTRKSLNELPGVVAELAEGLKDVSDELREVSRGIHPTILTEAGLGPALRALARRSDLPVDVDVSLDERLPTPIETAAYYIASEALTNVTKHAHASVVQLVAAHDNGVLTLEVSDDGIGGVDAARGSGILGLTDRAEALGGTISIVSPPRRGTTLTIRLPSLA
jgi:GAF domain-containing protein